MASDDRQLCWSRLDLPIISSRSLGRAWAAAQPSLVCPCERTGQTGPEAPVRLLQAGCGTQLAVEPGPRGCQLDSAQNARKGLRLPSTQGSRQNMRLMPERLALLPNTAVLTSQVSG